MRSYWKIGHTILGTPIHNEGLCWISTVSSHLSTSQQAGCLSCVCSANSLQFTSAAFARLSKQPMTDAAEISICLVSQSYYSFSAKTRGREEETWFCMLLACTCLLTENPKENIAEHLIFITLAVSQFLCLFSVLWYDFNAVSGQSKKKSR